MKLKMSACIEAPKEKVWQVLADVTNVSQWVAPILSARCPGDKTGGIGTVRTCELKGSISVVEEWIAWEEGSSYTYQAHGFPLMKWGRNTWSVEAVDGKTLLTTEAEVEIKGGIFGKLLEPLMRSLSNRMGEESLAAIKYLIETGQPYTGKFSSLPRAAMSC